MPVLPLKRMVYHMPESNKPQDFETQGTWRGCWFSHGRVYQVLGLSGDWGGEREKNANPVACALKKKILKLTLQAPPDFND